MNNELVKMINEEMQTELPSTISYEELLQKISAYINHLIEKDFQKLVLILYKTDVDERKLKQLLQENSSQDAATIIATLIIEREQQKIISRKKIHEHPRDSSEEKW